jgi:MFS family permease
MAKTTLSPPVAPDSDWPSPAVAWYTVGVLFIAYTVAIADRFILSLLIEPIKIDLGLSDTKVSLLHGLAFAIFFSIMGVPIARIAARVGVGVGEAALSPPAFSMVADLFPPYKLGRALSVYTTGAYIGAGLVFIIGGLVLQTTMSTPEVTLPVIGVVRSWQVAFFMVGLPGLFVALLMFTVKEPVRRMRANTAMSGDAREAIPLRKVYQYMRARWPIYGTHILGFSFLAVVFNSVIAWTPAFLTRSFDMGVGQTGPAVGTLVLVFGTSGILVGGWLADRLVLKGYTDGAMRVGVIAGLGCIPFALLTLFVSSVTWILALYGPLLFFSSFGFGAAAAALQQVTPNRLRALVSSIYLFVLNLIALGMGPTITALITDYVFGNDGAVGLSIATVAIVSGLLSSMILASGLKSFRAEAADQA